MGVVVVSILVPSIPPPLDGASRTHHIVSVAVGWWLGLVSVFERSIPCAVSRKPPRVPAVRRVGVMALVVAVSFGQA